MADSDTIEQATTRLDKVEQVVAGPDKFELATTSRNKVEYVAAGRGPSARTKLNRW